MSRSPRTVVGLATLVLVAVLAAFAVALVLSNAEDRRLVEARFRDRARVSASLTEAVFSASSGQNRQQYSDRFGGDRVSVAQLDATARRGNLRYFVVLGADGRPFAASSQTPPALLGRLEQPAPEVRAVMAGAPFQLSDFIGDGDAGVMQYVSAFDAADGSQRYAVAGFPGELISQFLAGYLGRIPSTWRASAYVVDSRGLVVGSPVGGQGTGAPVQEDGFARALRSPATFGTFESRGRERAYAVAPVGNAPWRVVLSMPRDALYAPVGSLLEWLILLALAGVGVVAISMLGRAVAAAAEVRAANEELARSNLELRRSNEELEQFASVASHDLQEPLRKVQTFGDQLERRFGDQIPDEAIDYLRRMRRASARMSTLIEDLLRFSRVTTHAKAPAAVDLERVAREVCSDLEAPLEESGGRVEIGALPTVEADPMQMRQLLQNLIANGIKFRRAGVEPVVRLAPAPAAPGCVAFTVQDNGIGFEPQYEDRIFRVFERLHPRDVYQGTGIGLALCRKIAERHGGTIEADGDPGEGARFTVTLPASQSGAPAPAPAEPREPAHA